MEKFIETGETISLSDGKDYLVFSTLDEFGKKYIFLLTTTKPIEIRFAEQTIVNEKLDIRIIENQKEKLKVLELFQKAHKKDAA